MASRRLFRGLRCTFTPVVVALTAATGGIVAACPAPRAGFYGVAQAAQGKTVFDQQCASCHKADLSGDAGPPLAGAQFLAWLQFTHITGSQLLAFISSQMPYNTPGSLTKAQYQDVFSYILSVNGYPAGATPLDAQSAGCVEMLPYPKQH